MFRVTATWSHTAFIRYVETFRISRKSTCLLCFMIELPIRFVALAVLCSVPLLGQESSAEAESCSKGSKPPQFGITHLISTFSGPVNADTRPGRCPHAQYVMGTLPCSVEGNDTVCPWNYKCCPMREAMFCSEPCKELPEPCEIKCPFGLKVSPSPCKICECAESPCLTTQCSRGKQCNVIEFEPCAYKGVCGYTYECVVNKTSEANPVTKPKRCLDYWLEFMPRRDFTSECYGSDGVCPGDQKCCVAPPEDGILPDSYSTTYDGPVRYCVDPCEDAVSCGLRCERGLQVVSGCELCQCVEDPFLDKSYPPRRRCKLRETLCIRPTNRSSCPLVHVCS